MRLILCIGFVCLTILVIAAEAQQPVTTSGGAINVVPKYSAAARIVNSAIFESGGKVGIGTTTPSATLSVNGGLTSTSATVLGNAVRFYSGPSDGNNSYGDFRTNPSTGNSVISAKANTLFFNWDHGTGGVVFGDSASHIVGSISGSGNAVFSGTGSSSFAGNLGIGTTTPSSKLTVAGIVQSTKGGFRFPDGTLQNTAGIGTPGPPGSDNTAVGIGALNPTTQGIQNTAMGALALSSDTTGQSNTAFGHLALNANTTGIDGTAIGDGALTKNTTGGQNTAIGVTALGSNVGGSLNTAVGTGALFLLSDGGSNTAVGNGALSGVTGTANTGFGVDTLSHASGGSNIALGYQAGFNVLGGDFNIEIGNMGQSTDNEVIRLGSPNNQLSTYIAGINGVNIGIGSAVLINSNGQLGTIQSSARYKQDVHAMAEASDALMQLRPVTFHYKQRQTDGTPPLQYGLIAEEVARVYPELIVYGKTGQVESIQYHELPAMLLNEIQKQHRTIQEQQDRISALEDRLSALEAQLKAGTK